MNHRLRKMNLALVIVLLFGMLGMMPAKTVEAQTTTLEPGDIAVILTNMDLDDALAFVALTDIAAGTEILFTDSGWKADGTFNTINSEGGARYTVPEAGLTAGDIVYRAGPFTATGLTPPWSAANDIGVGSNGFVLSSSGDQVLAFQGSGVAPSFIYGLNDEGAAVWQDDSTSSNTSALPTGLTNGLTAIALQEIDNVKLNCTENLSGTKEELLAYIGNTANWVGDDTTGLSLDPNCSFTITNPEPPIVLINELDSDTASTDVLEFVELYDGGLGSTALDGKVVVFYNGSSDTSYAAYDLDGYSTDANGYFLLGNAAVVPTPSIVFADNFLQNGADAVALYEGNASDFPNATPLTISNLIDAVVYDTDDTDDTGLLALVNAGQPQVNENSNGNKDYESNQRCPNGSGGLQNTDTYIQDDPTPGAENCVVTEFAPSVVSTYPIDDGSASKSDNIIITFSEPVTVTDTWFNINCSSSGAHTATVSDADPVFTLDPDADFVSLETCTVTIYATQVTDDDTEDPPDAMEADYVFDFSIAAGCGDPYTFISAIQGTGETSPLAGQVVTVEGIITADYQTNAYVSGTKNGFYMQSLPGAEDTEPLSSEGIFVYSYMKDVVVGDHVRVTGTAVEYSGITELSPVSQILTCNTGQSVTPTEVSLPVTALTDWEKFESMLVIIPQTLVISEYFNFDRYGEIILETERFMQFTAANEPDVTGFTNWNAELAKNSITLDDGLHVQNPDPARHPNGLEFTMDNLFRGGDTLTNVTGILDYYSNTYRIQPTVGADFVNANPRTTAPEIVESDLKVASFNVLNYFLTLTSQGSICSPSGTMSCRGADTAEELARQRAKILAALIDINADVYGLMEIENDSPVALNDAVADLVAGLNDYFGTGTYAYIETGAIGTDAIKQAILYRPASVTPLGTYQVLTSTIDARFIDTKNRPVLAQLFEDNLTGESFIVAVNHLKSKSGPGTGEPNPTDPLDFDLSDGAGWWNITRKNAAMAMVDWLENDTYFPGENNIVIIGDLNSYDKEDPIDMIKLGADDTATTPDDYVDMLFELRGDDAYGYLYSAQIGYLDYALVNTLLADNVIDVNFWHINADESDLINYDMSFKQPPQDALYAPDAYRSSDHDPVIITLNLNYAPIAVDDTYSTNEDTTLNVAAPGVLSNDTDAEGATLTAELVSDVTIGTLTFSVDGSFTYVPVENFFGDVTFTYRVSDGVKWSEPATVTISVVSVNDAPVAVDDQYSVDEDDALSVNIDIGLLANDYDVDEDILTVVLVTDVTHGALNFNSDGSFFYLPDPDFSGEDTFTYKATDGVLESEVATVTITVGYVNDWVVANDDAYETTNDVTLVVDAVAGVLANDELIDPEETVSLEVLVQPTHGILDLNLEDGAFDYIPDPGFFGTDTFEYQVNSELAINGEWSDTAIVTITVKPFATIFLPIIRK